MRALIYLLDKELKAQTFTDSNQMTTFLKEIPEENILWLDDTEYTANIPLDQLEDYTLFLRSLMRTWKGRITTITKGSK